jgi:hypothetical protein
MRGGLHNHMEDTQVAAVELTVEELTGDQDTSSTYLTVAREDIPVSPDGAGTVNGKIVAVVPGLSFLVLGGDGDPYAIEELIGDPDEDSQYIVVPKSTLDLPAGTVVEGATYITASGPVLLIQVPDQSAPPPPPEPSTA